MTIRTGVDYYRLLNVRRDAAPEAIHRAYRALARSYHPDRTPRDALANGSVQMRLVNEAYACLKNPATREAYDRSLKMAGSSRVHDAILRAADQFLQKVECGSTEPRDRILEAGHRRVGVRLLPVLDKAGFDRWIRWTEHLALKSAADWSVVLACRVLVVEEFVHGTPQRMKRATAIDLIESRIFGAPLPYPEYRELFRSFIME